MVQKSARNMKILIIAGHLDDSIIASGGLIKKAVQAGARVDVVCFGRSDEDYATLAERDSAPRRIMAEARRAHELLGVSTFTCFDYPDFAVQENRETYRLCIESIRKYTPDIILSHYWAEYFQHRAMARLACDAWWQAGWTCSADIGAPWTARALYHFEVVELLPHPTDIVDISDVFEAKMEAWRCFQSSSDTLPAQGEQPRHYGSTTGSFTDQLVCRARYYGSLIGVQYAEALRKSDAQPRAVKDVGQL
jgi:LmbE family N-acetylglucosaminyl deacetylase